MNRMIVMVAGAGLLLGSGVAGQTPSEKQPTTASARTTSELVDVLTRRLSNDLRVKTVIGQPVVVGSVTLIPILMIDVSFGGAGLVPPPGAKGGAQQGLATAGDAFLMSGEARPLGFVAITRKGTTFISVARSARPARTP